MQPPSAADGAEDLPTTPTICRVDADLTAQDALHGGTMSATTVLALGLLYFASVFAAGFVLGTARTLLLEPALGPLLAVVLELPLMLAFAWWICSRLVRRQPRPSPGAAVAMGAVAFGCLMVAEAALSLGLAGRSLAGHLAMY
jgi:hypothetical protein